jgi:hypothetical protein
VGEALDDVNGVAEGGGGGEVARAAALVTSDELVEDGARSTLPCPAAN